MIYFVAAEGLGHIKIGYTGGEDVGVRLADLQTASPVPLKLLSTIPGTMEDEKDLHRRFASARVCGEWFKPTNELLALIAPVDVLACGKVEVVTQSVSICVLTVGRKQMSKAMLGQFLRACPFNFDLFFFQANDVESMFDNEKQLAENLDLKFSDGCDFWGWCGMVRNTTAADTVQLIFERNGALHCFHYLSETSGPKRGPMLRKVTDAFQLVWARTWKQIVVPAHQLFTGV